MLGIGIAVIIAAEAAMTDEPLTSHPRDPAAADPTTVPEAALPPNTPPDTLRGPGQPPALGPGEPPTAVPPDRPAGGPDVLAPPERPDEIGRFGPYRVFRLLGRGGMGLVFEAEDPVLERRIALKVMSPQLAADADARGRFLREARAVAALDHDNVVAVHQVGDANGLPYLTMPLLKGQTLAARVAGGKAVPAAEVVRIGREIAEGLAAAHARGLVHRDIKPANVWLEAGRDRVKILDFGLARGPDGGPHTTAPGVILGTPAYMAPEQAAGQPVDPRCDLFSLGCVLYRLCTGEDPFRGPDVLATLQALATVRPPEPSGRNPAVPRALSDLVMRLLAKDPAGRPPSAAAVADALRAIEGRPAPPTRPRRRTVAVGLLAAAVVAAAGVTITLKTRHGTLVVKVIEPGVTVEVDGKQEQVTLDSQKVGRVVLIPGEHAVTVRQGNVELVTRKVTLRSGKDEIIEVDYPPPPPQPPRPAVPAAGGEAAVSIGQGLDLCEKGEVHQGLLWLARGLGQAPPAGADLERVARLNLAAWHRAVPTLRWVAAAPDRSEPIAAVAVSPDGRFVAAGGGTGDHGSARLWEAATGKPFGPPLNHLAAVGSVAFSPDGARVVTGSGDRTARVWEAATGKLLSDLKPHDGGVAAVAYTPDGKTVLTGDAGGTVRFWDAGTWAPLGKTIKHGSGVVALVVSPDGKTLWAGGRDFRAYDLATGRPVGAPAADPEYPLCPGGISPDGATLATASLGGEARLWDVATARPRGSPPRHAEQVMAAAFAPDGRSVVVVSDDATARLADAATGHPRGPVLRHGRAVRAAAFGPDGSVFVTGCIDGTLRLWRAPDAAATGTPLDVRVIVAAVAFSPAGDVFVTAGGSMVTGKGEAQFWDAAARRPLGPPVPHRLPVLAVAFSPDGKRFATGTGFPKVVPVPWWSPGEARVWEATTRAPVWDPLPQLRDVEVHAVAFGPGGRTVLTGANQGFVGTHPGDVRVWDGATGGFVRAFDHDKRGVLAVAVSRDGRAVATGGADHTARVWDPATWEPRGAPLRHGGDVFGVALSPDGRLLVTGSADGKARVWDVETGKPRGTPFAHGSYVRGVGFSPDGAAILTGSFDGTARLWDAATGRPAGPPLRHRHKVAAAAFSPDGRTVLTGGGDYLPERAEARLWDVPAPLPGDGERVGVWVRLATGLELDEAGADQVLSPPAWQRLSDRLRELGGPPVP